MSFGEMSQTRKRAWLTVVIWTLAGVWFAVSFFSGGGPVQFHAESVRHLAGAAALAFAYGGYLTVVWATRRKEGGPPLVDERDAVVSARAGPITLVVVLLCVFGLALGLWVAYERAGVIPVGWMWFLAYGSVILAFVTYAATTLVLDGRMGGHG